jgi:hypothetical protein
VVAGRMAKAVVGGTARARTEGRALRARRGFESRLLWILGSPRSGSTWLLQLLGGHPFVIPVNEPLIGWYLGPFLTDLPGWRPDAVSTENFTLRRVQRGKRDQFFADEFRDVWEPELGRMMRARFLAHAVRYPSRAPVARSIVAIKEPNGSQSADVILGALKRSRLLFLLRDGRDVVDSELAANEKGSWVSQEFAGGGGIGRGDRLAFAVQSAEKWLWRTAVVQEAYAAHTGPKLMLRYEDLLVDPVPHLRGMFEWLGLETEEPLLRDLVERHAFEALPAEDRGPQKFFRAASPGLWRENLSEEEQEAVQRVIGPKLGELGYEA